jgi:hypothetical protein
MRVRISGSRDLPFVPVHPPAPLVELNCWSPDTDRGWPARAERGCSGTPVPLLSQKHLLCDGMRQLSVTALLPIHALSNLYLGH